LPKAAASLKMDFHVMFGTKYKLLVKISFISYKIKDVEIKTAKSSLMTQQKLMIFIKPSMNCLLLFTMAIACKERFIL
jgi:hypothetical protein